MDYAIFFVPLRVPREALLVGLAAALRSFDLPAPPDRVLLSTEERAKAAGAWVFALGTAEPSDRRLHYGALVELLRLEFPAGFMSRAVPEADAPPDPRDLEPGGTPVDPRLHAPPEEVFVYDDGERAWELTSSGALLGGAVARLTVDLPQRGYTNAELLAPEAAEIYARGWTATAIGRAESGFAVDEGALEGAEILELGDAGWVPALRPGFSNAVFAGLSGEDPCPDERDQLQRIGVPPGDQGAAPEPAPALTLAEAVELENQAAELQTSDPERARTLLEQVLAAYPGSMRAHALLTLVLERLGDTAALAKALEARFEVGTTSRVRGKDAAWRYVIAPAREWLEHLLSDGEVDRALEVIQRTERALAPALRHHTGPLRERLATFTDLPAWLAQHAGPQRQIAADLHTIWLPRLLKRTSEARLEAARQVKAALKSPKLTAERDAIIALLTAD